MSKIDSTGTIFIREGTPLPTMRSMESERFLPGWRIVKNLDRQALTREIEGARWNFFYLAGDIRTTVFGLDRLGTLRRALKRILAKQEEQSFRFNSLQITKVESKWFLGIPILRVTAHSRHIQQGIALIPANEVMRRPLAAMPSERASHHGEVVPKHYAAVTSSS
jgi:hypothetical protein